ncbi:unnamed protein product [Ilex paraguariensis]|uniref:Sulfotransferase n=1 Tax=Ilex paraguariensis TaxID=185542 RepID=A0ABC8U0X6_9AQUA
MESSHLNDDYDSSLPKEKWWGNLELHQFHGYWFWLPSLQAAQQIKNNFRPLPTDVILASFPKTGTTWLKSLLYSIVNRSSKESLILNHPHELVPSLEIQVYPHHLPSSDISADNFPPAGSGIFNTHLPYQFLADNVNSSACKVVYVTRNPKDTLNSMWHFLGKSKSPETKPWTLDVAVDKFCRGVVPFGPYYDHVLEYWKESLEKPQKVYFITYEELKNDPKTQVKKLAEFLGCPFVGDDKELEVEMVVKSCSIETLKNHEVNKSNDSPSWSPVPYNSFFRQGEVGDHKNHFKSEMIERLDAITREKFHGSDFMYGI